MNIVFNLFLCFFLVGGSTETDDARSNRHKYIVEKYQKAGFVGTALNTVMLAHAAQAHDPSQIVLLLAACVLARIDDTIAKLIKGQESLTLVLLYFFINI